MRYDAEILNKFRRIIDALRQKKMTRQEALRRLREIGDEMELDQWQIIEDLRTRAPENQRELARDLTDLLAAELRKGDSDSAPDLAAPGPPVFSVKESPAPSEWRTQPAMANSGVARGRTGATKREPSLAWKRNGLDRRQPIVCGQFWATQRPVHAGCRG